MEWEEFKSRLILEYGSLHEFGRAVQDQFLHLTPFSTKREVAEILAPKIKDLTSVIILNYLVFIYHAETTDAD